MKFGKQIQSNQVPGWSQFYLDYKFLKKIINSLAKGRPADAAILSLGIRPDEHPSGPLPPASPFFPLPPPTPSLNGDNAAALQAHRAAFFFKLERELEKINAFYLSKEADLKVRLKSLIDKRKVLASRSAGRLVKGSSSYLALREGFAYLERQLASLQQFIEINATGFRKILKKWDKRSKSNTKELYLARQVEVQPCFNREVMAELSDVVAANLLELETSASDLPEDEELASAPPAAPPPTDPDIAAATRRLDFALSAHDLDVLSDLESNLSKALSSHSAAAVEDALRVVASSTRPDDDVSRILWRAILTAPTPDLAALILRLVPLDWKFVDDINDRTTLHEAAIAGALELVRLALENGVDPSSTDVYGRHALHYASLNGHANVLAHLVGLNATSPSAVDLDGYTPLLYAVVNGHDACLALLVDRGVSVDPAEGSNLHPLSLAAQHGHCAIARVLLRRGATVGPNAEGLYPMHIAARAGHADMCRLLIAEGGRTRGGADVPDKYNVWTPLFHAAEAGNVKCVSVLLEAGCDPDALDEFGKTALFYAAWNSHVECVNLLAAAAKAKAVERQQHAPPKLGVPPAAPGPSSVTMSAVSMSPMSDDELAMGLDSEADLIPSLSLPPPIIPLRIYGHSFLSSRSLVQLSLGHLSPSPSTSTHPPPPALSYPSTTPGTLPASAHAASVPAVRLYSQADTGSLWSSLKLVMTPKPDVASVPHNVVLPQQDEREVFSFQVEDLGNFSLEFSLYPSFGSRIMGRAVALPSTFQDVVNQARHVVPLLDNHLKVIGEVAFQLSVVKPFEGVELAMGGRLDTYWKSTAPSSSSLTPSHAHAPTASSTLASPSTLSLAPASSAAASTTASSLVTASSLEGDYLRIVVQVTRDLQAVAYPDWILPVPGLSVGTADVTAEQFERLAKTAGRTLEDVIARAGGRDALGTSAAAWNKVVAASLTPLSTLLETLPSSIGVALELRYTECADRTGTSHVLPLNDFVDAVLRTVYASLRTSPSAPVTAAAATSAPAASASPSRRRRLVLSSFDADVSTALQWKQPHHAVFFAAKCGLGEQEGAEGLVPAGVDSVPPSSPRSVRHVVKFAKSNNLLGVLLDARILLRVPALLQAVKESGLMLATFGRADDVAALRQLRTTGSMAVPAEAGTGLDACLVDGVLSCFASGS